MVDIACAPPLIYHWYRTGAPVMQKGTFSGAEPGKLLPHPDIGEFTNKPKNAQEPQDHDNDYDKIQDHLNGARHWDV
jgi:hypothetical protein